METPGLAETRISRRRDEVDRGIAFARFMARPVGRGIRIAAGGTLLAAGAAVGGTGGIVLAAVGVIPLLAGMLNLCLLAPIVGAHFRGRDA